MNVGAHNPFSRELVRSSLTLCNMVSSVKLVVFFLAVAWSAYANLVDMMSNMSFAVKGNRPQAKAGHGYKNFEFAVRTYDKEIFQASMNVLERNNIEVKGFYHVSTTVGHWIEVLEEHLMVMDGKRFASSLFTSKMVDATKLTSLGMKLSTGWSSVLEIADSVEINFDAASSHSNDSSTEHTAAYTAMTTMISNLHVRNGLEKIHVKPYADVHAEEDTPKEKGKEKSKKSAKGKATRKVAPATLQERLQLGAVLGEVNSINDMHAYCFARQNEKKHSYVFLMHNQETNCTNDLMKHLKAQVRPLLLVWSYFCLLNAPLLIRLYVPHAFFTIGLSNAAFSTRYCERFHRGIP